MAYTIFNWRYIMAKIRYDKAKKNRKKRTIGILLLIIVIITGLVSTFTAPLVLRYAGIGGIMTIREGYREVHNFSITYDLFDYDFDFDQAYGKGLTPVKGKVSAQYLDLQSRYDQALSVLLEKKLNPQEMDAELRKKGVASLDKHSIRENHIVGPAAYYRCRSHLNSGYLYLRSNIKLERLSIEDITILRNNTMETPKGREKLLALVSRTYQETTKVVGHGDTVYFYYTGNRDSAPLKSIVLWITYKVPNYAENDLDNSVERQWRQDIENLIPRYEHLFSQRLNYPVYIQLHDVSGNSIKY